MLSPASMSLFSLSEVEPRRDPERPRLIGQVTDARARSALLVEGEERPLVGQVVAEERDVPLPAQDAERAGSRCRRRAAPDRT